MINNFGGPPSSPTQVVSYPSYGFQTADGDWRIQIAGMAYQTPPWGIRKKMMIRMLANVMKASDAEIRGDTFQERIWPFFAEADKGLRVRVRIGGRLFLLRRKTRRNGRFFSWLSINAEWVRRYADVLPDGRLRLPYQLEVLHPDAQPVDSHVELLSRYGLSVISDIDDTIKETSVCHRRELLLNTFVRRFRSIDGMSEVYRRWYDAGADFHYVSSSPWQLYESLQQLQREAGFPSGTMHLRNFRLRDQVIRKMMLIRRQGKATEIRRLLRNMPDRKFLLVGDSGEKDPEIYQRVCRQHPQQVKGLFIREISERPLDQERLARMHRAAGGSLCSVFTDSEELHEIAESVIDQYVKLAVAG